jgi:hypothetical protein
MSGRIYDQSGKATCKKCKGDMFLSSERNFNGPKCKNKKCNAGLLDAEYDEAVKTPGSFLYFKEEYLRVLYEDHMKKVVDRFSKMVNTEELYFCWMNEESSKRRDERISFWPAGPKVFFDLTLSGEFNKKGVRERFIKKQQEALTWLKANTLTFDEYSKQFYEHN